jgi:hypothetical protein
MCAQGEGWAPWSHACPHPICDVGARSPLLHHDPTTVQHTGAIRDLQSSVDVLVDEQYRDTSFSARTDGGDKVLDDGRSQADDSSSTNSARGLETRARASASIRCSPLESKPLTLRAAG